MTHLSDMAALLLSAGKLDHAAALCRAGCSFPLHGPQPHALGFALSGKGETIARWVLTELRRAAPETACWLKPPKLSVVQTELTRLQSPARIARPPGQSTAKLQTPPRRGLCHGRFTTTTGRRECILLSLGPERCRTVGLCLTRTSEPGTSGTEVA